MTGRRSEPPRIGVLAVMVASVFLIERREGTSLASTFLSVVEPFADRPFLQSVERLPLDEGREGDVALKVTWEGGADYVLSAQDEAGSSIRVGDLVMQGRLGFVRTRSGAVQRMTLVGGTRLEKGERRLAGAGVIRGAIRGTLRKARGDAVDGLVLDGPLPDAAPVQGLTAVVSDGAGFTRGHLIAGVSTHAGRPVLTLAADPAFSIDAAGTSRHSFFPGRSWSGPNRYAIATVSTLSEVPGDRSAP